MSQHTQELKQTIIDNVKSNANTEWWLLNDYLDLLIQSAFMDGKMSTYGTPIQVISDIDFFND